MKRYVIYGLLIVLVVGAILCYQLYQNRKANLKAAEGFEKQAKMIEKMRGK